MPASPTTPTDGTHEATVSKEYVEDLRRIQTAGAVSISADLFEKLYLSPDHAVKGDLRKTFGNPTPV